MENKPLILIVDDMKDNRLIIKMALKKEGYILEEASNGQEAVQKCRELKPDVILMDAIMPVVDGYNATKAIRKIEEFNRTPILMITSLSEKSDKIKALEAGVNDFISKPFDKHELIARCSSYANLSKINKQYISASKNPDTQLPNKFALLNDIKLCNNPKIVLFRIQDYELLEQFYTNEIAIKIEKKFTKMIFGLVAPDYKDASLYHTSEGEFALLKDDIKDTISPKKAYENCTFFYNNVKDKIILVDNYEYDIVISASFAHSTEHLFEHARMGLNYAVKENMDVIFANEIAQKVQKEALNNIQIIQMVKKALSDEKVISYFQPLYNNKTKKIEKYESLVRIIDENSKMISPFFFLDIAKKGKYYTQITKKVLQNSFNALELTTTDISINISATDIEDRHINKLILDFCKNNPKKAKRVVFELLEDESFKDFSAVKEFIKTVKSYGALIAIDDFGSGYSNFERLLDFQPDILKIDGSLIKNIDKNQFSRDIVETMQDFATKIGVKTVAEFVSSETIFNIVNEIGIDYTQGYFIDEPRANIN